MSNNILETLSEGSVMKPDALEAALLYAGDDAGRLKLVQESLMAGIDKKITQFATLIPNVNADLKALYQEHKDALERKVTLIKAMTAVTADALREAMGFAEDKKV